MDFLDDVDPDMKKTIMKENRVRLKGEININ
jgi:hypothetical protein